MRETPSSHLVVWRGVKAATAGVSVVAGADMVGVVGCGGVGEMVGRRGGGRREKFWWGSLK